MKTPPLLFLIVLASAIADGALAAEAGATRAAAIEAHTRFLAHDLLEGRDPGTRGYDIAAEYVAAQYRLAGLQPAGDGAGYFQQVPLRRRELVPSGLSIRIHGGGQTRELVNGTDVAVDASPVDESESWSAELAFVGWGIDAPALGFSDYDGIDVRGKAVVLLEGAPASLPGALRAHYSWIRTKEEMAARHGAVAVLTIKTPAREKYASWERTRLYRPLPAMSWLHPDGRPSNPVHTTMTLGPEVAGQLMREAGKDLALILATCEAGPVAGFELPQRIDMARRSTHATSRSATSSGFSPAATRGSPASTSWSWRTWTTWASARKWTATRSTTAPSTMPEAWR